jgi:hypothetical protein
VLVGADRAEYAVQVTVALDGDGDEQQLVGLRPRRRGGMAPERPGPRRPKVWIGGYGPPQPMVKYAPKANPLSGGVPVPE